MHNIDVLTVVLRHYILSLLILDLIRDFSVAFPIPILKAYSF